MAKPVELYWTGPTQYVDGTPYGQADHGGYDVQLNGVGVISVPVAWNVDLQYTLPVEGLPGLKQGDNTASVRTVAANGQVSDWTPPVTFQYASVPKAPPTVGTR
jgi:hypothetical protein